MEEQSRGGCNSNYKGLDKGGFSLQKMGDGQSFHFDVDPGDIRATEMKELNLGTYQLPMERALGLQ